MMLAVTKSSSVVRTSSAKIFSPEYSSSLRGKLRASNFLGEILHIV